MSFRILKKFTVLKIHCDKYGSLKVCDKNLKTLNNFANREYFQIERAIKGKNKFQKTKGNEKT